MKDGWLNTNSGCRIHPKEDSGLKLPRNSSASVICNISDIAKLFSVQCRTAPDKIEATDAHEIIKQTFCTYLNSDITNSYHNNRLLHMSAFVIYDDFPIPNGIANAVHYLHENAFSTTKEAINRIIVGIN